jgi:hypothetical protein
VVAGTNGGLLNYDGTFGNVWANPDDNAVLASGQGNVPGQPVSMSLTRTEMLGLFAALTHVRLVIKYFHMVPPPTVVLQQRSIATARQHFREYKTLNLTNLAQPGDAERIMISKPQYEHAYNSNWACTSIGNG